MKSELLAILGVIVGIGISGGSAATLVGPGRNGTSCRLRASREPFPMPQLQRPVFPDRTFAITAFGAVGERVRFPLRPGKHSGQIQ